jgi:1-hydroxycarotenoid 3,4-desaturase
VSEAPVIVVGGGVGGLVAAVDLARAGRPVMVLERATEPGGKMRRLSVEGRGIDAGPTVFTMRWIFEDLFRDAGAVLKDSLRLQAAERLARHAWREGGALDLYADTDRSAAAIEAFSDARNAQGYLDFCRRSRDVFDTLRDTFIADQRPSPTGLVRRVGLSRLDAMWRTAPFRTLWSALGEHFPDPRLRQLFGRYATYVGSSPLLTPATLMLVAHVEQDGVWLLDGGMRALAQALWRLGEGLGVDYRFDTEVAGIETRDGRVRGVTLASGEHLAASAVVFNGDVSALARGMLGPDVRRATRAVPPAKRSLSALTWCFLARPRGFTPDFHNVFFAADYPREFRQIFAQRSITEQPTVYLCAQDRGPEGGTADGRERFLMLINAPADGDHRALPAEPEALQARATALLADCGLTLEDSGDSAIATAPEDFARLFPGSGGALYGRASHGMFASFARPGAHSRIRGLYLAGGSVHPGPGVPMAAMSGRLAARALLAET